MSAEEKKKLKFACQSAQAKHSHAKKKLAQLNICKKAPVKKQIATVRRNSNKSNNTAKASLQKPNEDLIKMLNTMAMPANQDTPLNFGHQHFDPTSAATPIDTHAGDVTHNDLNDADYKLRQQIKDARTRLLLEKINELT